MINNSVSNYFNLNLFASISSRIEVRSHQSELSQPCPWAQHSCLSSMTMPDNAAADCCKRKRNSSEENKPQPK